MGITDKVSGRVKQAAGDLLGDEGTRQQGKDEERKGEAKEELAREDQRAEQAEARADREAEQAQARADEAAQREYDKADRAIEREDARAEARREEADERASEVERLERRT
jgi:uncharacterized protein YjbJ (UPF0337 family)